MVIGFPSWRMELLRGLDTHLCCGTGTNFTDAGVRGQMSKGFPLILSVLCLVILLKNNHKRTLYDREPTRAENVL